MGENPKLSLRVSKADLAAMITKGALGSLPLIGPIAAEIVGNVIPNQRLDRMAGLLRQLDARLSDLERDDLEGRFSEPEFIDLLEEGLLQASRAVSSERIGYIADVLKAGLTDDDRTNAAHAKLLRLLAQLNDPEVIILRYYGGRPGPDKEFIEKHEETILRPRSYIGANPKTHEAASIHDSYVEHLVNLRLLKNRYGELRMDMKVEDIHKPKSRKITYLGRMLLREIGLLGEDMF